MSELIVDLHLHSKYSRATSKNLDLASLYQGAKIKGIDVLGTADFTHPLWFKELEDHLVLSENGLYQIKPDLSSYLDATLPKSLSHRPIYFVPTVEISCIYRRHDRLRKLHIVVVMPSLEKASQLNQRLDRLGNLSADGRPTLGLDSLELLKLCLDVSTNSLFIPAHIWTPWFGMFGSKSGFDSLEEAFGDMKSEIYAVETGLSSDPPMNWRVADLDSVTLVSNSDAHSQAKLGREASVITGENSYQSIIESIKTGDQRFKGTIEFFPQEGKYYGDGHRQCKVNLTPQETTLNNGLCPVCSKPVTVGVLNRVEEIATRLESKNEVQKSVEYIVPLPEIIAELKNVKSPLSKTVQTEYLSVLSKLGDEFSILRKVPITDIKNAGFSELARSISAMRHGQVTIEPGYDGIFGRVSLDANSQDKTDQLSLLT